MAYKVDINKTVSEVFRWAGMLPNVNLSRTFFGGLEPDEKQTDVAHMVYFSRFGKAFPKIPFTKRNAVGVLAKPKSCESSCSEDCKADHFYGLWSDSKICIEDNPKQEGSSKLTSDTNLESLMLCSFPILWNSGSHRIASVMWIGGERYAMAFEEGGFAPRTRMKENKNLSFIQAAIYSMLFDSINENFFVEPLTRGAEEALKKPGFIEDNLIPSAVRALTGYDLYPSVHKFKVEVYEFGSGKLLEEGCAPSSEIFNF